jgi:excisionase family DNA binding protein
MHAGRFSDSKGERPMSNDQPLTEPLLDANEAAKLLRVPRSTLYELVRSRGLPHVRIGERGLRFTRADLEGWVVDHTYGTRAGTCGSSSRNASDTRLAASSRSTKAR